MRIMKKQNEGQIRSFAWNVFNNSNSIGEMIRMRDEFNKILNQMIVNDHVDILDNLLIEVCVFMGVNISAIQSPSRLRELTDARAIFCRRVLELYPDCTWEKIGSKVFRDHAAAYQAAMRAYEIKELRKKYEEIYARKTSFNYALMAIRGEDPGKSQDNPQKQGPVLSYHKMEEREQDLQAEKPTVRRVS